MRDIDLDDLRAEETRRDRNAKVLTELTGWLQNSFADPKTNADTAATWRRLATPEFFHVASVLNDPRKVVRSWRIKCIEAIEDRYVSEARRAIALRDFHRIFNEAEAQMPSNES